MNFVFFVLRCCVCSSFKPWPHLLTSFQSLVPNNAVLGALRCIFFLGENFCPRLRLKCNSGLLELYRVSCHFYEKKRKKKVDRWGRGPGQL